MALVVKDRVRETSTTAGTGTITLAGAVSSFQSFAVIGNGNTTYYAIVDGATGDWEVGIGTYTASGTTLSRDTVLESSNSGSLVNFSSNTKDVFVTYPAERSVYTDGAGTAITPATASILGVPSGGTGANTLTGVVKGNGTSAFTAGQVNLASEVAGDLPFSNLAQGSALSVLGVAGNATADVASIAAASDHQVLRRSGTTVGFGAVNLGQANAITGTLPVGNGGTGQTTTQAAINALAGATTSGRYLRGNGTNVVMSAIQAGDVPTLNQNTTGTASNVTGIVAVANGGTGANNSATALSNLGAYPASNPSGYTSNTGTVTSVSGTGSYGGLSLSGTVTSSGSLTFGGTPTGTWPISITGSSASATTATALSTASGSAPSYAARAWVNFNGTGTPAIRASGNVSSITDNGTGIYRVNFTTSLPDTDYAAVGNAKTADNTTTSNQNTDVHFSGFTTSAVTLQTQDGSTLRDTLLTSAVIFR